MCPAGLEGGVVPRGYTGRRGAESDPVGADGWTAPREGTHRQLADEVM